MIICESSVGSIFSNTCVVFKTETHLKLFMSCKMVYNFSQPAKQANKFRNNGQTGKYQTIAQVWDWSNSQTRDKMLWRGPKGHTVHAELTREHYWAHRVTVLWRETIISLLDTQQFTLSSQQDDAHIVWAAVSS